MSLERDRKSEEVGEDFVWLLMKKTDFVSFLTPSCLSGPHFSVLFVHFYRLRPYSACVQLAADRIGRLSVAFQDAHTALQ